MDQLCRLCMNFGCVAMEPIFRSVMANCIASKIAGVTQLTLFEGDELPANACQQCIFKLDVAYTFIQKCTLSDKALRAMLAVQNVAALDKDQKSNNSSCGTNQRVDRVSSNTHRDTSDLRFGSLSKDLQKDPLEYLTQTSIDTVKVEDSDRAVGPVADAVERFPASRYLNQISGLPIAKDAINNTFKETEDILDSSFAPGSKSKSNDHINNLPTETGKTCKTITMQAPTEMHKCFVCHGEYSSKYNLARHVNLHKKKKSFQGAKAQRPGKDFETSSAAPLKSNGASGSMATSCRKCFRTFVSPLGLTRHTCHLKKNQQQRFCCDVCLKTYARIDNLKHHKLLKHANEHLESNISRKKLKLKKSLTVHALLGYGKRSFNCTLCNKSFQNSSRLSSHMLVHSDKRPHGCTECGIKFKRREHLRRHMNGHKKKKLPAQNKRMKIKNLSNLKNLPQVLGQPLGEHSLTDTHKPSSEDIGDNLTPCKASVQSSGESPKLESNMEHQVIVCEKILTCKVCGQTFSERADFDSHAENHKVSREFLFPCNVCERRFTSEASVANHMSIHVRVARHKCPKCTQCFKTMLGLKEHVKLHEKENDCQFVCSICSETFSSDEGLQYHLFNHAN